MTLKLKKFNLKWIGETVPSDEEVENTIVELNKILDSIEKACNLVTHTVILTDDINGPSVHVYGMPEDSENLYATYNLKTKWVSITEEDDGRIA